jgi:4a-hydroxytetrahydrobiopterin dehydratase
MPKTLSQKSCIPCRGGIPPLGGEAAQAYLPDVPGWSLRDDSSRIERAFVFKDFAESLDFVNRVGALAEAEGHHPDIEFGWGYARVSLHTHKIDGLHENDFIMAAKIGGLPKA